MPRTMTRWSALLTSLALLTALPAWADAATDLLQRADALIQSGHASDAEALLADGVVRFPRDAGLHVRYGELLAGQKLDGLAKAHFQAAVTVNPSDARALAAYGHALVASMEAEEALPLLRRAAELDPGNASARYDLARILIRAGSDAEAEATRFLEEAVRLDPGNHEPQFEVAQMLLLQEKPDQAQVILERLAAGNPPNYRAQGRLGRMLVEGGKDKARGLNLLIGAFDQAIRDPDPEAAFGTMMLLALLLQILDQEQRQDEMAPLIRKLVTAKPDKEEGYFILASVYGRQQRWGEAVAAIEEFRTRQPQNPSPDRAMAGLEAERGRWPQAREWFLKAVKRAPDVAEWRKDFGELAEKHKADADAVAQYRQLLRLEPKEADSYVRLARALIRTGPKAKPEAKKLLQQALKLDAASPEAQKLLKTL